MNHGMFIKYSFDGSNVAQLVCEAIEDFGKRCWIVLRHIPPGSGWAEAILAGIFECKMMVLIFSTSINITPPNQKEG